MIKTIALDTVNAEDLKRAASYIKQADGVIVAAGAGMGVDSGLPDFRGDDGFWKAYPALAKANIKFTTIASPRSFEETPRLAWGFYGHRLKLYRETPPHIGFAMLKTWGERMPQGYFVFTSNIDGQFQKAGFDPYRIVECHGSIHHLQCLSACKDDIWPASDLQPLVDEVTCRLITAIPKCPYCGKLAKPNVLQFNDWSWIEDRAKRQQGLLDSWLKTVKNPVIIELGAGKAIPTVRHFSSRIANERHGHLIRINPRDSDGVRSANDVGIALGAFEGLTALSKYL